MSSVSTLPRRRHPRTAAKALSPRDSYLLEAKSRPEIETMTSDRKAMTDSEWLTASEAAEYLRIKPRTLLLWVRLGKVKGFALSGSLRHVWRFRRQDLDAALLETTVLPSLTPSVRPAERMGK